MPTSENLFFCGPVIEGTAYVFASEIELYIDDKTLEHAVDFPLDKCLRLRCGSRYAWFSLNDIAMGIFAGGGNESA